MLSNAWLWKYFSRSSSQMCSCEHPFEWVDNEIANYAVYDKSMRCVIATIQTYDNGKFLVQMATQCDSCHRPPDRLHSVTGVMEPRCDRRMGSIS